MLTLSPAERWELGIWNLAFAGVAAISFGAERMNWIRYEVETHLWSLEFGIWVLLPLSTMLGSCFSFGGKFQVPDTQVLRFKSGHCQNSCFPVQSCGT